MSRTKRIRLAFGWTQDEMATRLGVAQPTIVRWEKPDHIEAGPVAKLLDLLERDLPSGASSPGAPAPGAADSSAAAPFSSIDAPRAAGSAGSEGVEAVRPAPPGGPDAQFSGFSPFGDAA